MTTTATVQPAQKVGGVRRHRPKKSPSKSPDLKAKKGKAVPQVPIDPMLNTQPSYGNALFARVHNTIIDAFAVSHGDTEILEQNTDLNKKSPKSRPKNAFAAHKLKEPKKHLKGKQNNSNINQPKPGF